MEKVTTYYQGEIDVKVYSEIQADGKQVVIYRDPGGKGEIFCMTFEEVSDLLTIFKEIEKERFA